MFGYTESIRAIVIGATGGIGSEFRKHLEASSLVTHLWATSRHPPAEPSHPKTRWLSLDITQEDSIAALATQHRAAFDHSALHLTASLHNSKPLCINRAARSC